MGNIVEIEEPQIGKREKKKAETKLKIMQTFINVMESKPLDLIKVEDLCKEIGISKVTFFNYFSSKEQVMEYFIYKWSYDLSYQLFLGELKGVEGIKKICNSTVEHPAGKNIMLALMKFYVNNQKFSPIKLSQYELYLFNNEAYKNSTPFLDLAALLTAVLKNSNISQDAIPNIVFNLITGFYGVPMLINILEKQSNNSNTQNIIDAYSNFIDSVLCRYF